MHNGLLATLQNRLINVASSELASILSLLQDVTIGDEPDDKFLAHGSSFTLRCAYSRLSSNHEVNFNAGYIRGSKAPSKVKIFGLVLYLGRLGMMANLHRKTITIGSSFPRCDISLKGATHLALLCPCAA
ncbi:DEAD-box ATP-dependent RNA helicase 56 [Hordeum vulgare]|nr:DEAD-box ATP-dependent RNA helicase 56 [Hordeum vulgare]